MGTWFGLLCWWGGCFDLCAYIKVLVAFVVLDWSYAC